ncbi:MAG TPA: RAMP superfamily CRISPR-associated protein [bacterium]|nr:RAMP superfamily CRISPR-associated protein [bacterium]
MKFRAITAILTLRTPLHVGTGVGTETADDLVRRDARGRLLIPGTALAGALRSIATRLAPRFPEAELCHALKAKDSKKACDCLACQLFGDVNPQEDDKKDNSARLLFYNALLDSTPQLQIRDGVGIDRTTGAAARRERVKFNLEVLPTGTTFKLRIELDRRLTDNAALQLLAATLAEWQAGRGVVGGRIARGLGAFDLLDVQFIELDLDQPDVLMTFLRDGPPWNAQIGKKDWITEQIQAIPVIPALKGSVIDPIAGSWIIAEFTLAAKGPFLTHDLAQAGRSGFDHAPILAAYALGAKPILPGSSLRGVLRSQAERIARTLATLQAWDSTNDQNQRKNVFLASCPACNPLTTKTTDEVASCNSYIKSLSKEERDQLEQVGAENELCLACRLFGSAWNGSRLRVEDAPLKEGTQVEYKVMDFLAIDRFTGGSRDGAKFDAVVLWKPQFRVRLFMENPKPWELGWLALTLRDLHGGLASIGFGRAKGFGQCTIEDRKLTIGILNDDDFPLPQPNPGKENAAIRAAQEAGKRLCKLPGATSGLYKTIMFNSETTYEWSALANGWVTVFNAMIRDPKLGFRRKFELKNDSYFTQKNGYWLPELYPARMNDEQTKR